MNNQSDTKIDLNANINLKYPFFSGVYNKIVAFRVHIISNIFQHFKKGRKMQDKRSKGSHYEIHPKWVTNLYIRIKMLVLIGS